MSTNYDIVIAKYNDINDTLIKEKNYISVIMGYCESKIDSSEVAAEIYMILLEIKSLHEKLFNDVDEIVIDLD